MSDQLFQLFQLFQPIDHITPYVGVYEPKLVALSIFTAILVSFVPMSISSRINAAATWKGRCAWVLAGSFSMGGGIWAMHFIGMLAFSLPCLTRYDPALVFVSMLPAIAASAAALLIVGRLTPENAPSFEWTKISLAAVLMGGGIGAMHYSGMAAMEAEATIRYRLDIVAISVVVAVLMAFSALSVKYVVRRHFDSELKAAFVSAPILGLAVACMHYTAMEAAVFYPLSDWSLEFSNLPIQPMALFIATASGFIVIVTLLASIAGRQWELAIGLEAEVARREALEQEAKRGRARLQAIFDAVVDAIVTIDVNGKILQWSTGAEKIFGYKQEEVLGKDLTFLMPEPHRSRHANYVGAFLNTREAKIIGTGRELTALRKNGTEFPIELTVSEVVDGDETFFTGILRDITARKIVETDLVRAREEAEAANMAKSQFLATMSHEIRTPMNGIIGMTNLLSATQLNIRQERLVGNVSRSGQALLGVINNILDFAKIEAGKFNLSETEFDLREIIDDLADLFADLCEDKGIELVYYIEEDVPSRLFGDAVRLRQILVNLVGNAAKFTERGEILIEISAGPSTGEEELDLAFRVKDTGIGISPKEVARIFESFHQVDGSMTRQRGGTGLGLAITKRLVEIMGGEISVESEVGQGSTFAFTAHFRKFRKRSDVMRIMRRIEHSPRALLIDTNTASAHVIKMYLTKWNVDAATVFDTNDADRVWRQAVNANKPFKVVIVDVKGLGDQALTFVKAVRARQQDGQTRFILLVSLDTYMTNAGLAEYGDAVALPKPVSASALYNALVEVTKGGNDAKPMTALPRRKDAQQQAEIKAHILVAEDNAVNQEVACGILESFGCTVVTAADGMTAMRLFASDRFDAVLMDCEMPIMDGMEATRGIRNREKAGGDGRHTPIIALTAHALNDVRERCIAAGMDDFLTKPFDDKQLYEVLTRWITGAAAEDDGEGAAYDPGLDNAASEPEDHIDGATIERLRALDRPGKPSRFSRTISQFADIAPALLADIRRHHESGDAEALWRAAHSLKSSAGSLGALRLAEHCSELEKLGQRTQLDGAGALLDLIGAELDTALQILNELSGTGEASVASL